jgi:large subunit ribosomal protein L21
MKYAIVEAGGKQYRAEEGRALSVDLMQVNSGDEVILDKVLLLVDGDDVIVGSPYIKGLSLATSVMRNVKGEKIFIFKYKPKINYRRRAGHRQQYTLLMVNSIKSVKTEKAEK